MHQPMRPSPSFKTRRALAFSVSVGSVTTAPGRFMFLRSPIVAVFCTSAAHPPPTSRVKTKNMRKKKTAWSAA